MSKSNRARNRGQNGHSQLRSSLDAALGRSQIWQPPDKTLEKGAATEGYVVVPYGPGMLPYVTRPFFNIVQAEAMLWDQQVWFGLQLGNAPLISAKVEVKAKSPEVQQFVQEQWDRLWQGYASKIVATKYFGFAGFEVLYETGKASRLWEIKGLRDFHPRDVRPMLQTGGTAGGDVAGVAVYGQRKGLTGDISFSPTRLFGLTGLWLNYEARYSSNYGRSLSEKAYPAWWDKAMPGGAYDMRRLRAVKDAWIGDVLKYPTTKNFVTPSGEVVSGKDIAREISENRVSGGVVGIPSDSDPTTGLPYFEYQPPTACAPSEVVKEWIEDCDYDIFDGLLIPREVVEAAESGSGFSGRSIPMVMFLGMREHEFRGYIRPIKVQNMEPLVERNFGASAVRDGFEIVPIPFLDQFAEQAGGGPTGGPLGGATGGPEQAAKEEDDGKPKPGDPVPGPFGEGAQFGAGDDAGGHWVTLESGTHVKINGQGRIVAGPNALVKTQPLGKGVKVTDGSAAGRRKEMAAAEASESGGEAVDQIQAILESEEATDAEMADQLMQIGLHHEYAVALVKTRDAVRNAAPGKPPVRPAPPAGGDGLAPAPAAPERGGGTAVAERPEAAGPKVIKGTAPKKEKAKYDPKASRESKAESLDSVVSRTAEEWGIDPKELKQAIDYVAEVHFQEKTVPREDAKLALRESLGVTAADISKLENSGFDYASAHKAGGLLGKKFADFDSKAQEMAREYSGVLGLSDPDDPNADFAAEVWDVLREGSSLRRFGKQGWEQRKTDPEVVSQAAQMVYEAQKYKTERGDAWEDGEDEWAVESYEDNVPFGLSEGLDPFMVRLVHGWLFGVPWDESKHPRSDDGRFGNKHGGVAAPPRQADGLPEAPPVQGDGLVPYHKPARGQKGIDFDAKPEPPPEPPKPEPKTETKEEKKARIAKQKADYAAWKAARDAKRAAKKTDEEKRREKMWAAAVKRAERDAPKIRKKFEDMFSAAIDAKPLPESKMGYRSPHKRAREVREAQRAAAKKVFGMLSPMALQVLDRSVKKAEWFDTVTECNDAYCGNSEELRKKYSHVRGFYDAGSGKVTTNGSDPEGVLAHELTHALDNGAFVPPGTDVGNDPMKTWWKVSSQPAWVAAYEAEINVPSTPLSAYGRTSALEGFAEFGRLAIRDTLAAKTKFPMCWKIWKDHGLAG